MNSSNTKDYKEFEKSLRHLHDSLLKDYQYDDSASVIIALSRKGPKIVHEVFNEKELEGKTVVTEFAMPVLFAMMEKEKVYHVFIIDDAVYYGSTLKNTIREIREYETLFGLSLDIHAYVAIRDKNALQFADADVHSMPAWRMGYGHYFVKEAMSRFRKLHQCMEVEFPVFSYKLTDVIDTGKLTEILRDNFKDENIYEERYEEGVILNVLLPKHDSQFSKIRLYPDSDSLHLTVMSPYVIPNDDTVISRLMVDMNYKTREQWAKICELMFREDGDVKASEALRRNRHRDIISLANFIFSYHVFIYYKNSIDAVLGQYDEKYEFQGLGDNSIFQLIGDNEIAQKLESALYDHLDLYDFRFPSIPVSPLLASKGQNYEEPGLPAEEERRTLETHNLHMIRNSDTCQLALSAVFFNQALFIEKWSRHRAGFENRHLWFGYTHDALLSMLDRYGRNHTGQHSELALHKWVDNRIDMGCVVPQYILDYATNQWLRVFRPGENEDVLLSHLSRFVIHVYYKLDRHLGLGYVPDHFLSNMLAVLFKKLWCQGLQEQFFFSLILSEDNTLFVRESDAEDGIDVIKYLVKMYVLQDSRGELTIAPRITDEEFRSNTTLDSDMQSRVDGCINEVCGKFNEANIPVDRDYSVFNYYLNADMSDSQLSESYKEIARQLLRAVKIIDTAISIGDNHFVTETTRSIILDCYRQLLRYDVEITMFWGNSDLNKDLYWQKFEVDARFRMHVQVRRMMYMLNLIVSVYAMGNIDSFREFIKSSHEGIIDLMHLSTLYKYSNKALEENSFTSLYKTHNFTRTLHNALTEIAEK